MRVVILPISRLLHLEMERRTEMVGIETYTNQTMNSADKKELLSIVAKCLRETTSIWEEEYWDLFKKKKIQRQSFNPAKFLSAMEREMNKE